MQVSVIIPVYNAASFVAQAVASALQQPETVEVLLIEDGSSDNSWEVCQLLAAKHDKVRLLRHPNGENRGAGASRNLGMQKSSGEYIAFLDADDFYLPRRFEDAKKIFQDHSECDGVYGAAGMYIEGSEGLFRWQNARKSENYIQTMTQPIEHHGLPEALIIGKYGYFILNTLIIKRIVLSRSGYMNEALRLHQDTDFIIKVACVARLWPGNLDVPICMWRIHDHNRVSAPRPPWQTYQNRMAFWMSLYRWARQRASTDIQEKILDSMVAYTRSHKHFRDFPLQYFPATIIFMFRLLRLFAYPLVISDLLRLIWRQPQKMIQIIRGD